MGPRQKSPAHWVPGQILTPGIEENDHSFKLNYNYEWNKLNVGAGYSQAGSGFDPEVGFSRNSFRKPEANILSIGA